MTQISKELMEKFINNTCTDDELVAINGWLDESEENAASLFGTELAAMYAFAARDDEESSNRIARKIRQRIREREVLMRHRRRNAIIRWTSAVAAVLAIVVTFGWMMFKPQDVKMMRIVATTTPRTVVLPDSTIVYLNENSQLRYPASFGGSADRCVELAGEGYFDVAHDSRHPFRVTGRYLTVEVLGTQFYFNSRDSLDNSVGLIEGSIEVSAIDRHEGIILVPGQRVCYDIASGQLAVDSPKTAVDIAWHSRIIPFENANMSEIRDILQSLYGITINLDTDIDLDITYSGGTIYCRDIDSTLMQLSNTIPLTFTHNGDSVDLHLLAQ